MAKNKFLGLVLLVLYTLSLFLSFYFDLVAQYRNFFAVYFFSNSFFYMVSDL